MTEAEALADIAECRTDYELDRENYYEFLKEREESITCDEIHYSFNKLQKIGAEIECAENRCRKRFKKKVKHQAFCCTKHKDKYWNRQRINDRW